LQRPESGCQALAITRQRHNGLPLDRASFALRPRASEPAIARGVRIGLTKGAETPWRLGLKGSPFLSRTF